MKWNYYFNWYYYYHNYLFDLFYLSIKFIAGIITGIVIKLVKNYRIMKWIKSVQFIENSGILTGILTGIQTGILTRILLNQSKNSEITELWNEWS